MHAKPGARICTYVYIRSDLHCRGATHSNDYPSPNAHPAATNSHPNGYLSPNAHPAAANTYANGYLAANAYTTAANTHTYVYP